MERPHTRVITWLRASYTKKNLNNAVVFFGRLHEKEAIAKYKENYKVIVKECGLFFDLF